MSRNMDNKTEKVDDSVGVDVTLAEDGEKGPHCAHGESAPASLPTWNGTLLILHVFRGLCEWLFGDVNADRLGLLSGPTLLFEKACRGGEEARRFYACAACRDRKDCSFFQWEGEKVRRWGFSSRLAGRSRSELASTRPQHCRCDVKVSEARRLAREADARSRRPRFSHAELCSR